MGVLPVQKSAEVTPMSDLLMIALMLLLVVAAAGAFRPGQAPARTATGEALPRLVNMSDDDFRITDGRGHVVAVVHPSPYTADASYRAGQVVFRKRGSAEAIGIDDVPVTPGVQYLVTAPVARAAHRPDFLTDADLFKV